jgi:Lantibiotic dehydratase, N terminus
VEQGASLGGDWRLWRDFAVRSAGFPVRGLDAFGPGDESARLQQVAREPRFQEAVTWQNPAALENAVLKVAAGAPTKPSRARQREEIVASYWQRYCAKNDTIGFFGPLAWGRIEDDGPPLHVRSGALVAERSVHLEAWPVQALARQLDDDLHVAAGQYADRELRETLERHADPVVRAEGLAALDRLEAARAQVEAAGPGDLRAALADLDAVFSELTGQEPVRNAGRAYGARTLCYVDCMRDVDVRLGPGLIADSAPALRVLFEASRWYSGAVHQVGERVVRAALPASGRGPLAPVLRDVVQQLMALPPELTGVVAELHHRIAELVSDPDPATIADRAAALFADHRPAWPHAVFNSTDLQLAARSPEAVQSGDYLAVVGDVHPGANPLMQGVFAHRYPGPGTLAERFVRVTGPGVAMLLPPFAPGLGVDARGAPVAGDGIVPIAVMPETRAQGGLRTWLAHELELSDGDVVDRDGALRLPVMRVFAMAIFIAGVRVFSLLPEDAHAARVTIGRTVLRRESWSIPAAEVPQQSGEVAAWARARGMPRRLFSKSPLERKPMYLDTESPVLARILCRHARQAGSEPMAFTEMLPGPEGCWLAGDDGQGYVSELRLVAVDAS